MAQHIVADPPSSAGIPAPLASAVAGPFIAHARAASHAPHERWAAGLAHACYDHRYFDLMADTIAERFTHVRIELADSSGSVRAVQPAFLVREDLLMGAPASVRRAAGALRQLFPSALSLSMLMIGNATGEGVLATGEGGPDWSAGALAATLPALGRALGASLVVFKDFPAALRPALGGPLRRAGFARLPSMPGAAIDLNYRDFDDYLAKAHSRSRRADLRRKFRDALADGPIDMQVLPDLRDHALAREAHTLYENVYQRSALRFEHLTPEFFLRLGRDMPDRARFFLWRKAGRLVAFNLCMLHHPPGNPAAVIKDNYIGLDYAVALDRHLYFLSWRDIIAWAINSGIGTYWTAPLNYDPKLNLKMKLAPLDLYVRHVSPFANPVARRVIPLFGPTRAEPILKRFDNFSDL